MSEMGTRIELVAEKPALYVGATSIRRVGHYLDGYADALAETTGVHPFRCWQRWLEWKFGIFSPAWGWPRILLHRYEDEKVAIAALPVLLAEYEEFLQAHDGPADEVNAFLEHELRSRLREQTGSDSYAPRVSSDELEQL